jgi:hypothetical protein
VTGSRLPSCSSSCGRSPGFGEHYTWTRRSCAPPNGVVIATYERAGEIAAASFAFDTPTEDKLEAGWRGHQPCPDARLTTRALAVV